MSSGFSEIKENVNQLIENKLNKLPPAATRDIIPTDSSDSPTSYASAVGTNHVSGNLKSIMMTTKNVEITEQNEKKKKSKKYHYFWQKGAQPTRGGLRSKFR